LLDWYRRRKRDLPWRRTKNPYAVWVSEIMLQQTRVETVIPYYERFLKRYPDPAALAAAPESELLEAWAGLGYYRRARQLQAAAKQIVAEHGGEFPRAYDEIRALPGVGDYTAAAVSSIAFELPHGVLDGNVVRVATRLLDDARDVSKAATKKFLQQTVDDWIAEVSEGDRGDFNQAFMELGATLCTAKSPKCLVCPLQSDCLAFRRGTQPERPVKPAKQKLRKVRLTVALVERGSTVLMRQRPPEESLMPGFWELPQADDQHSALAPLRLGETLGTFTHGITVRSFRGTVVRATLEGEKPSEWRWISRARRAKLPLTTITRKALQAAQLS